MTVSKSLRALTIVFFLSGLWDIIAGFVYAFMIGTSGICLRSVAR